MTLNDYQNKAWGFAHYENSLYPFLKLAGEAGEVCEKIGKAIRDGYPEDFATALAKELGDVLWYISAIAHDYGFSLQEIAEMNIDKLEGRKTRGTLGGSGDNR